jgi:hypothetical protein
MTISIMIGSDPGAVGSWLEGNENKFTRYIGFFARKGMVVCHCEFTRMLHPKPTICTTQSGTLPSPLWNLLKMIPIKSVKEFVYSDKIFELVRGPDTLTGRGYLPSECSS